MSVNVFADIYTTRSDRLQHLIQSYRLLLWRVATIINQYIYRAHVCLEILPEFRTFLVTNKYRNLF